MDRCQCRLIAKGAHVVRRTARLAGTLVALAVCFCPSKDAVGQIRDPEAIFEYAEQREETRIDTHLGPNIVDRLFQPFKRCDERMESVGGPQIVGLYAPIWQTGTQSGVSDLLSQSLNLYAEWELLHCDGNEGTLYAFYLHESDSLGN